MISKKTKDKILNWIFENHEHHHGAYARVFNFETGEFENKPNVSKCFEGDSPYVNSKKLEKFIKELPEKELNK